MSERKDFKETQSTLINSIFLHWVRILVRVFLIVCRAASFTALGERKNVKLQ